MQRTSSNSSTTPPVRAYVAQTSTRILRPQVIQKDAYLPSLTSSLRSDCEGIRKRGGIHTPGPGCSIPVCCKQCNGQSDARRTMRLRRFPWKFQSFGSQHVRNLKLNRPQRNMCKPRIRLGKHLHELRKLQWGTLSSPEDIEEFRTLPLEPNLQRRLTGSRVCMYLGPQ